MTSSLFLYPSPIHRLGNKTIATRNKICERKVFIWSFDKCFAGKPNGSPSLSDVHFHRLLVPNDLQRRLLNKSILHLQVHQLQVHQLHEHLHHLILFYPITYNLCVQCMLPAKVSFSWSMLRSVKTTYNKREIHPQKNLSYPKCKIWLVILEMIPQSSW